MGDGKSPCGASITQREIPAYAGMTWVCGNDGGVQERRGCAGMTESPTFCGPGAIHAARVNGKVGAGGLRILWRKWYAGEERSAGISDGRIDGL